MGWQHHIILVIQDIAQAVVKATCNLLITPVIKHFAFAHRSCQRNDQTSEGNLRGICQHLGLKGRWSSQLLLQAWKHGTQPAFQDPPVHGALRHLISVTILVAVLPDHVRDQTLHSYESTLNRTSIKLHVSAMRDANSASVEAPLRRHLFKRSVVVWVATGVAP